MKEKKHLIILALILIIVALSLYAIFFDNKNLKDSGNDMTDSGSDTIIGGDRDEHGCLIPAGYSWNDAEQECVREWETGELRYQVTSFESCMDAGYPILESYPRQCRTPSGKIFIETVK